MSKTIIFTDIDLDGSGCYLVYKWLNNNNVCDIVNINVSSLREKFLKWLASNSLDNYDTIYFFDLDTTAISDLIDIANVTIIDHHKSHTHSYKKAKTFIQVDTSCVKLVYKYFKGNINLSEQQLILISLINDYDCYELKFEDSYNLNILYWYYNGNRTLKFAERFVNGFNGFTKEEKYLIKSYKTKFFKYFSTLRLYTADISIKNKKYNFISTFADNFINDISHKIFKENSNCKVVLLINSNNKRVFLRAHKDAGLDISKFAEIMCDGGGHELAAGGFLTEKIKILSKEFQPL